MKKLNQLIMKLNYIDIYFNMIYNELEITIKNYDRTTDTFATSD